MKAKTTSARFSAPAATVFEYIADINKFPQWATTFCLSMWRDGDDIKMNTPEGEMFFKIEADSRYGIVDMWSGPSKTQMARWPARVVDDNCGGAVFMFTAIQLPGLDEELFAAQCTALCHEMDNIARALNADVVVN